MPYDLRPPMSSGSVFSLTFSWVKNSECAIIFPQDVEIITTFFFLVSSICYILLQVVWFLFGNIQALIKHQPLSSGRFILPGPCGLFQSEFRDILSFGKFPPASLSPFGPKNELCLLHLHLRLSSFHAASPQLNHPTHLLALQLRPLTHSAHLSSFFDDQI